MIKPPVLTDKEIEESEYEYSVLYEQMVESGEINEFDADAGVEYFLREAQRDDTYKQTLKAVVEEFEDVCTWEHFEESLKSIRQTLQEEAK